MKRLYIIALLAINVIFCISPMEIEDPPLHVQLLDAAQNNKIKEMKFLIKKGADINSKNSWGWTSLHHAANNGNIESIKFLLANSADINIQTKSGKKAALVALFSRNEEHKIEAIKLFFEYGIDLLQHDQSYSTAIDHAAESRDCLVLLLTETATLKDSIATMCVNTNNNFDLLKLKELDLINLVNFCNNLKSYEDSNVDFDEIIENIKKNRKKVASLISFDNEELKRLLYVSIPNVFAFEQTRLQIMKNIIEMSKRIKEQPLGQDIIVAQSFQELSAEIKEKTENSIIREFLVGDEEFAS